MGATLQKVGSYIWYSTETTLNTRIHGLLCSTPLYVTNSQLLSSHYGNL